MERTKRFFNNIYVIRYAGTLLPLFIVLSMLASVWTGSATLLTWERPLIYGLTGVCLLLGLRGVVWLARRPMGDHPSVFIVTMFYQKLMLTTLYLLLVFASLGSVYPAFNIVPDWLLWALFIGCSMAIMAVNIVLFFGGRRGWLEQPTDAVPFRPLLRYLRNKRDEKRY